jgi:hypothetical protein
MFAESHDLTEVKPPMAESALVSVVGTPAVAVVECQREVVEANENEWKKNWVLQVPGNV